MIKYHDNKNGRQYDDEGHLTNNFNFSAEIEKGSFVRIYYRIDTKNVDNYGTFSDKEQREAFYQEIREVLKKYNIPEGLGGKREGYPAEHLYIHPNNISGVVFCEKIRGIAEDLNRLETTSCRWVDVYERVSTMTDEEYINLLQSQESEIKNELKERFKTKRSNLYIVPSYFSGPIRSTFEKHYIPRVRAERETEDGIGYSFVYSVFEKLLQSGEIVSAETRNGTGYRTAKKGEKKSA